MRWISPGAVVGVVLWIVASIGFAIYIKNFSSYGAAYGAFGAAIVLLLWLYLSANAFLFGAELNAELERRAGGRPIRPAVRAAARAGSRSVSSAGYEHRPAAARARRAQPAVRPRRPGSAGQQRRRGGRAARLERGGVGRVVARDDRLARALEEEVGDLDARRARAQRGERVDAPLDAVGGLDERLEVGVAEAVGLVVDDQRGAVGLVGEHVDDAVEQRPVVPSAKAKPCSRCTRARRGQARAQRRCRRTRRPAPRRSATSASVSSTSWRARPARGRRRRPAARRRRAGRASSSSSWASVPRTRASSAGGAAPSASAQVRRRLLLGQAEDALEVEAVAARRVARERRVAQRARAARGGARGGLGRRASAGRRRGSTGGARRRAASASCSPGAPGAGALEAQHVAGRAR